MLLGRCSDILDLRRWAFKSIKLLNQAWPTRSVSPDAPEPAQPVERVGRPRELAGLPEDLRDWLDEAALVRLVFEALHTVEQDVEHLPSPKQLATGSPRLLLTLLTYSYGIGLYDSAAIERRIAVDPQLRYFSARTTPSANVLRGFRRYQRPFLQQSLSRLIQLAWNTRLWGGATQCLDRAGKSA